MPQATAPTAPAFDADLLSALPGGNMLTGLDVVDTENPDLEEPEIDDEPTEEIGTGAATEAPDEDAETEAEEPEETEDEASEEDPEAKKQEEDPERGKWPESAQKRVDKLTAQKGEVERERDAAKAEADAAKRELEQVKAQGPAPAPQPTAENPLAAVLDEKTLGAHVEFNQRIADWALENMGTGGTIEPELDAILTGRTPEQAAAEPREFTAKEIGSLLSLANRRLNRDIPARAQWLRTDKQAAAYVSQHYPQMLKTDTEEGQLYARYQREFPAIKSLPTWRVALIDLVRGAQVRIAEEKTRSEAKAAGAPGKPAAPVAKSAAKTVPLAPAVPGAPRGTGTRPAAAKPAKATVPLKASMDAEDLAALLGAR